MKVWIINDVINGWGPDMTGADIYDGAPDDYSPDKYRYTPSTPGIFDLYGFFPTAPVSAVSFAKRQENVNAMNQYMSDIKDDGGITQPNFELFLSDTAVFIPAYLGGSSRLMTWIETANRNGYNATTIGFKTKTGYRGALLSGTAGALGQYQRSIDILAILNDL